MLEEIAKRRIFIEENIAKGFNADFNEAVEENSLFNKGEIEYDELEKAVYADTAQNRKLGRVGQEYHRGKGNKQDIPQQSNSSASKLNKTSKLKKTNQITSIKDIRTAMKGMNSDEKVDYLYKVLKKDYKKVMNDFDDESKYEKFMNILDKFLPDGGRLSEKFDEKYPKFSEALWDL